jgi:serine protease AprX
VNRRTTILLAMITAGAVFPAAAAAAPDRSPATGQSTRVIVRAADADSARAAARMTSSVGGRVTTDLPLVRGFAATLPGAAAAAALARTPGVTAVTPDATVRVQSDDTRYEDWLYREIPHASVGATNAYRLWLNGFTGRGSRIALVDTGIADSADLRGRVVPVRDWRSPDGPMVACVDFSGEHHCGDSYGHGTFLAGLIAGDGTSSRGRYHGVAPKAELISIKIAGADGSADVSKVLAAIQWAVSFKDTYGIDVLNLSLGTDSPVSTRVDPLNHAVQRAWQAGLTVVVSASNRGPRPGTIAKPGDDPAVITVGATDDRRTLGLDDDRLPNFSGRGPTTEGASKPDVVAPGISVVSLRAPGSTVERLAPGGVDATYRRGSGTSMSTAIVSGVAALVHQAQPAWTNQQVKDALNATARPVATNLPYDVGHGHVDAYAASRTAPVASGPASVVSDASGLLDRSRGTVIVTGECVQTGLSGPQCAALRGERTAQGELWSASEFAGSSWHGSSWHSSQWVVGVNGSSWYGSSWHGSSWHGSSWHGSSWHTPGDEPGDPGTPFGVAIPGSVWYGVWS